jgi:4'-phosphopantetheinyl transferase
MDRERIFRLGPHDVHVWSLRLNVSPIMAMRLAQLLSAGEVSRAGRFVSVADRGRFSAVRGLLRVILSGYLGVPPEEVALEAGFGCKPRLVDRRDPRFNLSYSGGRGLVAVSAHREVGIDIEQVRDVGDLGVLAEICFSPVERLALSGVAASERESAFFSGWTRKEAFAKLLGEGLSKRLDSFDVSVIPGEPAGLLRLHGVPDAPTRFSLLALTPAAGYAGALAVDEPSSTVKWRRWEVVSARLDYLTASRPATSSRGLRLSAKKAS